MYWVLHKLKLTMEVEVTIITGDYKRAIDPTCKAFEVHECDTLSPRLLSPRQILNGHV